MWGEQKNGSQHPGLKRRLTEVPFFGQFRTVLFTSVASLLGGCAEISTISTQGKTETSSHVNKVSDDVPTLNLLETFTTEGKPTKVIETPKGLKDIYDPTIDQDVVSAFKRVKNKKYKKIKDLYRDGSGYEFATDDLQLIFSSRNIHHLDVMRSGCKHLISFDCGASWAGDYNSTKDSCNIPSLMGRPIQICEMNSYTNYFQSRANGCMINLTDKTVRPNIYYQLLNADAVGRPKIPATKNLKHRLKYFFDYQCLKW